MSRSWWVYCGTCQRLRAVLIEAPWSNFDLMASAITSGIGGYLLLWPGMFTQVGGVYAAMANLGPEWVWGALFLLLGGIGLLNMLWCVCPQFLWRLLARMGVAFCLLTFAINNLSYSPPPLSSVTYTLLSLWALWGVLRTKSSGR